MRNSSSWKKGTIAGMAGGLAASWVMVQFQKAWWEVARRRQQNVGRQTNQSSGDEEDATMKAAAKLARAAGLTLNREQKKKAGVALHYAFGTLMGGVYGAGEELVQRRGIGLGALYGTALFATADEIIVPAAGLSKSPKEYPLATHAYGLASHLVYGVTTEVVRRAVRRMM
jgi:hypothetical protein